MMTMLGLCWVLLSRLEPMLGFVVEGRKDKVQKL